MTMVVSTESYNKRTRYLWFREIPKPARKTRYVEVVSLSQSLLLGTILWYGTWRQYVFEPEPETVWNVDCLKDVRTVIEELKAERREG